MSDDHVDCPECGKPHGDLWEHELKDDASVSAWCGWCDAEFTLSLEVTFRYTATAIK